MHEPPQASNVKVKSTLVESVIVAFRKFACHDLLEFPLRSRIVDVLPDES